MRHEKRAARARQIEAAAYDILAEKGFAGLSIQAVAKAARASNETIYRWYGDKTGLFEALIRGNAQQVAHAIDKAKPDPSDKLSETGTVLLSMLLGRQAISLNRAAAADPTGTLGRALAREGRETVAPHIAKIMAEMVQNGTLIGDPKDITETWFDLLIGDLQVRRVTSALPEPSSDEISARAERALKRLFQLFAPETGVGAKS